MDILKNLTDPFYQGLALLGLFILLFGLVSLFVKERMYLTESLVAMLFGILFGPSVIPYAPLNLVNPLLWFPGPLFYRILMEFSRIVISFQVMAVGLCTPLEYIKAEWISIFFLLGPTMLVMWTVSALAIYLVVGLGWWESMMIGACLAPTDPVLANAVIKGKFANRYIPSHLRNLLSVESGANDGLGFPFLMLPLFMLTCSTWESALYYWTVQTWLYEIFLSILVGFVLGWSAKKLLEKSEKHRLIDKENFLVYSIALTCAISGLVALIASDDLLSIFIAGNVFAYDDTFHQATKEAHFQDILDMLFNITFFIFLGASLPWSKYYDTGLLQLVGAAVLILLLRRLPFIMLMKRFIPVLSNGSYKEAFFCGWFGPMGVGGIFFAMVVHHSHVADDIKDRVFTVVSFVVLSSVIIHGITVPISHISMKQTAKRKQRRLMKAQKDLEKAEEFISSPTPSSYSDPYADPYEETFDGRGLTKEEIIEKLKLLEHLQKLEELESEDPPELTSDSSPADSPTSVDAVTTHISNAATSEDRHPSIS